jgi:hypothetical protein
MKQIGYEIVEINHVLGRVKNDSMYMRMKYKHISANIY